MIVEMAYATALESVAMGGDREATHKAILCAWPTLRHDLIHTILNDAYRDALRQGVEREDVDESWYRP
jgi:hypothetical protein